jgi:hypothetical protein
MKTWHVVALGAGVVAVGAIAYFYLNPNINSGAMNPTGTAQGTPGAAQENPVTAATRSMFQRVFRRAPAASTGSLVGTYNPFNGNPTAPSVMDHLRGTRH